MTYCDTGRDQVIKGEDRRLSDRTFSDTNTPQAAIHLYLFPLDGSLGFKVYGLNLRPHARSPVEPPLSPVISSSSSTTRGASQKIHKKAKQSHSSIFQYASMPDGDIHLINPLPTPKGILLQEKFSQPSKDGKVGSCKQKRSG